MASGSHSPIHVCSEVDAPLAGTLSSVSEIVAVVDVGNCALQSFDASNGAFLGEVVF